MTAQHRTGPALSDKAKAVLDQARIRGSGVANLLLVLASEEGDFLRECGIDPNGIPRLIATKEGDYGDSEHSLYRVVRFAELEARYLRDERVWPPHLLSGILREGASAASEVLANLGLTEKSLRETIVDLGSGPERNVPLQELRERLAEEILEKEECSVRHAEKVDLLLKAEGQEAKDLRVETDNLVRERIVRQKHIATLERRIKAAERKAASVPSGAR